MKTDKKARIPKTITVDPEIYRAVTCAIGGGLASDFSDAIERGLVMLMEQAGMPTSATEQDILKALAGLKKSKDLTPTPTPHKASGDPLVGAAPNQNKKRSGETKFSRGGLVVKDPAIEAVAKKISKPKK